jgi:fido (protein-threonine AMPylation protein)
MERARVGRPPRSALFEAVDQGIEDLRRIGGLPEPSENSAIWSGIWYEETHNHTAIEGNTLLQHQVRRLLEDGMVTGTGKALAEYLEVQAYSEAARWVYGQAMPGQDWRPEGLLSLTELREIHRRVVGPVWEHFPPDELTADEGPGNFRRHDILRFAEGWTPPEFTEVPHQISDWLRLVNDGPMPGQHVLLHLAHAHAVFEQIHPFRDGNGRSGRLVVNLLLVRRGYPPAIVLNRDRLKYMRALQSADPSTQRSRTPDYGPLADLFARAVRRSIDRFLLPGLAGPHRLIPLSALVTQEVSIVALRRAIEKGRLVAELRNGRWYSTKAAVDTYVARRRPFPRNTSR